MGRSPHFPEKAVRLFFLLFFAALGAHGGLVHVPLGGADSLFGASAGAQYKKAGQQGRFAKKVDLGHVRVNDWGPKRLFFSKVLVFKQKSVYFGTRISNFF
jgi:hypothetical protein